jgi:hypothetical protein
MNGEPRRNAIGNGSNNQKESGNHGITIGHDDIQRHRAFKRGCASACRSFRRLFLARASEHLIQARFPASRRVAMNDSPLGRFVDGRDQCAYLTCIRLFGRTSTLIHCADAGYHAAIAKRSFRGLAGTFSGRFCVGHFRNLRAWRFAVRSPIVKMLSWQRVSLPRSTI